MPAIHTFDYRGDAVHVYRIEDRNGRGPWSSPHTKQWMWERDGEHDPGEYLPSHSMYDTAMRFGFINPQQMLEAFRPSMLMRAFETGCWYVAVYKTNEKHVRTMDEYQITFDIRRARPVRRICTVKELNDVLDASAYHIEVRSFDARGMGASADVRIPDSAAAAVDGASRNAGRGQGRYREPVPMGMEA